MCPIIFIQIRLISQIIIVHKRAVCSFVATIFVDCKIMSDFSSHINLFDMMCALSLIGISDKHSDGGISRPKFWRNPSDC